jgi:hypothetical protein
MPLSFHKQAADELRDNLLGGEGIEILQEGWELVYGSEISSVAM